MSTETPKIWRRSVLAASIEATTGTAIALASGDGAYNVFNAEINPESDSEDRNGQNSLSMLAPVPGALGGEANFTTEIPGSGAAGTAANWMLTFLVACGFQNTAGVLTPLTSQAQTLTIGKYTDGLLERIAGAQGGVTFKFEYGKTVKADWKFKGKWVTPSDVSNITPTFPTTIGAKFQGATISLTPGGGSAITTLRVSQMEIAVANTITLRPDAEDATGYRSAFIVGRKITVKMDPEAISVATEPMHAHRDAGQTFALSLVVGSVTGNIITFAAPNMFLKPPVKAKNRGDLYAQDLEFECARSAVTGDDELSITAG